MKPEKSVQLGIRAENFFFGTMNKLGLPCEFIDDWFDFEVCGKKVEVKSTQISVVYKRAPKTIYAPGRYDFTKEENREKQFKDNVWVCFILRNDEDFIIQGFCQARNLKKRRWISISKLRELGEIGLKEWIEIINQK